MKVYKTYLIDVLTEDNDLETITVKSDEKSLGMSIEETLKSLYQWDKELPKILKVNVCDYEFLLSRARSSI